jgi:probable phosphoglycerate mutase
MRAMRLLLLRHGRTGWNAQRRFQGQSDPPLDDVGRAQAFEVAAIVAALRPQLLISSDAARALQTAAPIAELTGLVAAAEPRLRERSLGHWEGLTRDEVAERFPEEYRAWVNGRDVERRGGESRRQVADRAVAVVAELPAVELAVLVTHSATAMALSARLLGLPQEVHVLGALANCHWSELVESADRAEPAWRLRAHNIGAPGVVAPLPIGAGDDAPDAEA